MYLNSTMVDQDFRTPEIAGMLQRVYWIVVNNSKRSNEQVCAGAWQPGELDQGLQVRARPGPYTHRLAGGDQAYFMIAALAWNLKTWMLNLLHLGDGAVMRFQRFRYQWIWQAGMVAKSGRNTVGSSWPATSNWLICEDRRE